MKPNLRSALALLTLTTLMSATASAADAPTATPAPDLAKGQVIATQVCGACHAADGARGAPANPIIAGQHPEYLVKQLAEFKSGQRDNAIMKGFASTLTPADMQNVAAFYAGKLSKPGFAKSKSTVAMGEKIYRAGVADRNIPACAGCHTPTGAGIPIQFPRLAGQHADYTEKQLVAFRIGTRANNASMTAIAAKLTDKEISAVSDYVAGLR